MASRHPLIVFKLNQEARKLRRSGHEEEADAIQRALATRNGRQVVCSGIEASYAEYRSENFGGPLQDILTWLLENLPAIIEMIMALFSGEDDNEAADSAEAVTYTVPTPKKRK